MATAQIFSINKEIGEGGLGVVLDSGGLRELMMDLADDIGLEFAQLNHDTIEALKARLDFGLEPVNPLDAGGLYNENVGRVMGDCLGILEGDPGVAILAHEYYTTDTAPGLPDLAAAAKRLPEQSQKPYLLTYSLGNANNIEFAGEMLDCGVPVISGVRPLLTGVKRAFDYRDFRKTTDTRPEVVDEDSIRRWEERLRNEPPPGESEVLQMLSELGVSATESRICGSAEEAVLAAGAISYPIVLKTAVAGLLHKSDAGGVHIGIEDEAPLRAAYEALLQLGPEVCVARMAPAGVEVAFGMVNDAQFGPVVMVSAGGTLVEVLDDRAYALAPFGRIEARRLLQRLKIWKLLSGAREQAPADIDRLAILLSRFSVVCHELGGVIAEMDVNPIIASETSVLAVDAVLVPYPHQACVSNSRSHGTEQRRSSTPKRGVVRRDGSRIASHG